MLRKLGVLCLLLSSLSCANGRAEDSFLRKDDVIVCVGDSITAAGIYAAMLQEALSALYPQAEIRVLNEGRGGDDAEGGASRLATRPPMRSPPIATRKHTIAAHFRRFVDIGVPPSSTGIAPRTGAWRRDH